MEKPLPDEKRYTYADYLTWNDDKRYELINGEVYMMSPAPARIHQKISGELFLQLATYLKGKNCEVYAAPFDVRLNAETENDTVVQPDLSIVCDPEKLDDRGCKGVPDMVIEILLPSTARRDQLIKFNEYRKAGVREYWIVNPEERFVKVHLLKNGEYMSQAFADTETIPVNILESCRINLAEVFPPLSE